MSLRVFEMGYETYVGSSWCPLMDGLKWNENGEDLVWKVIYLGSQKVVLPATGDNSLKAGARSFSDSGQIWNLASE